MCFLLLKGVRISFESVTRIPDPRPHSMKQPLHRRVFALLWAIAFVLGTAGDGFGLHPCPHHDGGTAEGSEAGNETLSAHHGHAAEAEVAHTSEAGHETPDQGHTGPCTCGSACQASAGVALPGGDFSQPTAEVVAAAAAAIVASDARVASRPPYFLPFALAPPA